MKRALLLALVGILCTAQTSRDAYREAYRVWREMDPNLEHDAASGGPTIIQRADRLAAEADKSAAVRKTFLEAVAQDQAQQLSWLENYPPHPDFPPLSSKADTQFVATETASVTRTMETFSNNPDQGIQQLRQALARERAALAAVGKAMAERRKSTDAVSTAAQQMEQAHTSALEPARAILEGAKDAPADTSREAAAWAEYYRKVGEAAEGSATPITLPPPPGVPSATIANPVAAPPTITPLPLVRYIGSWTYPATGGQFHGAQPESIDLQVDEENGQIKGTLTARFKLPRGSTGEPVLNFDFSGALQPTRNQMFNLTTANGVKGTVELIPGSAFNLLELNFQTDPNPGKVRQADVVLIKR